MGLHTHDDDMRRPSLWRADRVRHAQRLTLSTEDRRHVRSRLPLASDGKPYVDAVFEGGGVAGLAFLGVLRCLHDADIRIRKAAGTSAGALTAAAVMSQMPIDVLENRISTLDFGSILTKKTSYLIMVPPSTALDNIPAMLANLASVQQLGMYSTEPLLDWVRTLLRGYTDTFPITAPASAPWHEKRELKVVISDISAGEMRVLPDDLPLYGLHSLSVSDAVRLSMSIPLFFEPGYLRGNIIVDGGILSNFPLWIFDAPVCQRPVCPTFGFHFCGEPADPPEIRTAADKVAAIVNTMMRAGDRHYLRRCDHGRVVHIDRATISATDFTNDHAKDTLYANGYNAMKRFLLQEWSWDDHLEARGFKPV